MNHLATMHNITNRQTDRRTDRDIIMPLDSHIVCSMISKKSHQSYGQ